MMPAANNAFSSQSSEAPAQSEENNLQALAQQAMAEYLTPRQTEAIYELLQGESSQGMMQPPPATGTTNEFLQTEAKKINADLSPHELQLIHAQIDQWNHIEKRQRFLEKIFERAQLSPCFVKIRFQSDFRAIKKFKKAEHEIIGNFEDMRRAMIDGTIRQHLATKSPDLDTALSKIKQNQDKFAHSLSDTKETIQLDEIQRLSDNNAMLELSMKQAGQLGTLIQKIEQKCIAESRPENLAALKTRQAHLQRQHAREQTHISRQQSELQRLQMPWPEVPPDLCLDAGVETQPGPSTRAGAIAPPGLPHER